MGKQIHGVESVGITGDKQLMKELQELADTSARKIMRPAINAGLTPIRKRAMGLAKTNFKSDTISRHIKKSTKKAKGGSGIVGKVYVERQPDRTVTVEGRSPL